MNAGELDGRLIIQLNRNASGEERNEFGEPVDDWHDIATVACQKQDVGSREFPTKYKYYEESTVRFKIRSRTDLHASSNRFVYIQPLIRAAIVANIQTPTARQRIFNIYPPREGKRLDASLLIEAKEVF